MVDQFNTDSFNDIYFVFPKRRKKKNTKFKMKFIESRYSFGKENNSRLPIFPKYRFHGKDRIV